MVCVCVVPRGTTVDDHLGELGWRQASLSAQGANTPSWRDWRLARVEARARRLSKPDLPALTPNGHNDN
eukprot:13261350-Alexandrium_andersonii.AAC.1